MPKLKRSASKKKKRSRMRDEMHKFREGKLHSGSKHGKLVTDRKQAIAISLSESGQSRKKRSRKRHAKK